MSLAHYIRLQPKARDYHIKPLLEAFIVGTVIFTIIFTTSYFIYVHAINAQKGEIREGLLRTAEVIATTLDGDLHKSFVDRSQESSPEYKQFIAPLEEVLSRDDSIVFIYTTILRSDGKVYFVVDPTPEGDSDNDGIDDKSHIYEHYAEASPALTTALRDRRPVPTEEPYTDRWGRFMSAYVPFNDKAGSFVGVLGIDITAENYFSRLAPMKRATVRAMVSGFLVSFLVGSLVWFMRNFSLIINRRRRQVVEDYEGLKQTLSEAYPEVESKPFDDL